MNLPHFPSTRRSFLHHSLLAATAWSSLSLGPSRTNAAADPTARSSSSKSALLQRHRNIFNGDSWTFLYNPEFFQPDDFRVEYRLNSKTGQRHSKPSLVGGPFKASSIHRYIDLLADNGIDTFVSDPVASKAWYPSKTMATILDGYQRGDREFFRSTAICAGATEPDAVEEFLDIFSANINLFVDLVDAGIDWVAETAAACRRRELSPWVSVRMNDIHGSANWEGAFFNHPLLRRKDMRLQQASYGTHDSSRRTGLNYEKPEVREHMFQQIRELVEDYDHEGLILDWWRNPLCCEPVASARTVDMMSSWIRGLRALTDRKAKKTGKPFHFGIRLPGRLEPLKAIGLDIRTLCHDGTFDFICPSGYWCTTWDMPHDQLRSELGERVAIYGVIENGANTLATQNETGTVRERLRYIGASPAMLRANAAGKLATGADGILWFNFFCTDQNRIPGVRADYTALRDIERPEVLAAHPLHYSFGTCGTFAVHPPFEPAGQLPVGLPPRAHHAFRLSMGKRPRAATEDLVIQVILRHSDQPDALPVSFNDCWPQATSTPTQTLLMPCGSLTHLTAEHRGYNYTFPATLIREGWNIVTVENHAKRDITVAGIELAIMPRRV